MSAQHVMNMAETARALGLPTRAGWAEKNLTGVSTDTRTMKKGELFVALEGENFDGHDFLKAALEKGAAGAIVKKGARVPRGLTPLRVDDTLRALGDMAAWVRRRQSLKVAAITGSNGKTTTKEMIVRIVGLKYRTLSTIGNLNNLVGLPLTLLGLRPSHKAAVLEMGMNRFGEIARLTEIADPDVGLVTNVGPAHIEGLGGLRGVAKAKGELFRGLGPQALGVANRDDSLVHGQAAVLGSRVLTFGFTEKADVYARNVNFAGMAGTKFNLVAPEGDIQVRFGLLGRHNVANALAAAAVALAMGLSLEEIAEGLGGFEPYRRRLEIHRLPGRVHLIDDTYNANPASAVAALEVLASTKGKGRGVAVLGDMLELGRKSGDEHAKVGREAARLGVDVLVVVGNESRRLGLAAKNADTPPSAVRWFTDKAEAARWIKANLKPNDRILVKGSRGMAMEEIVQQLVGKRKA